MNKLHAWVKAQRKHAETEPTYDDASYYRAQGRESAFEDMDDALRRVLILDDPYYIGHGPNAQMVHQYQAWCPRCMDYAHGPTGNAVWTTKPPAKKAAEAHLERHATRETFLDRRAERGLKVVDTVIV